ncbi:SAM-dependent methyltransferase [Streptomyces sp. NBC_01465]|uniref:SAM-dependent methyltransferase n=1 Tax=Streptomyces sp. NBC_01465 TaxID=2903878 RepID=UPI002E349B0E|nr:SAM-dependent methyltransferase [Streptomyces sp. NBC_01465]
MTRIDTSKPHPARMYDWFLGGKDNYPVDVAMAEQLLQLDPRGREMALTNRAFMHRATRWLAESAGVRQFLDIGTGIPTEPNLHQIAQQAAPDARIVYCDNDPIVLAHAEALLRSTPEGVTEYVQADAREPQTILEQARKTLDFEKPVALSLVALLHFIEDDDAHTLVDKLVEQLPSGSYVVVSHVTGDFDLAGAAKAAALYRERGMTLRLRTRAEVAAFFEGLELVEPGVELAAEWKSDLGEAVPVAGDEPIPGWVGVARKG